MCPVTCGPTCWRSARRNVDVLAFAGLFLTEEHSGWLPALADKAGTDCRVRLLLGDPAGAELAARDQEYSIGGGVAGRVSAVLSYYRQLPDAAELRLHDTPLYKLDRYRFDDDMLINVHADGILAAYTPVMRLPAGSSAVRSSTPTWSPSNGSGPQPTRPTGRPVPHEQEQAPPADRLLG